MTRIAFIGAGSFGFTRELVKDILTYPLLKDAEIVLMDINKERLGYIEKAIKLIRSKGKYPAKVIATTSRKEALKGADAVICTILSGDVDVWQNDIRIPMKYGVNTNIGDTRSISGMFRALRTIPVMLDICRDIERYCPNAVLLNYTNPMAMLCRAMQKATNVTASGLCHSVQHTSAMLADWIGAPQDEITYTCAGINHMSYYIKYDWNGKNAIPLIKKAITSNKEIYNREQVRNELFLAMGYYVTESSGHASEYNWWFRKRDDLIEKYCTHSTGWNPGKYAYIVDMHLARKDTWRDSIKNWLKNARKKINLKRGVEYAAAIINALEGGEPFQFNGNVPNTGIITNIPNDACVEVPVIADKKGLSSIHVGALPPQCATLINVSVAVEEMTVEAALTGNPEMVYHAAIHDPLCAAVCSLAEIRKMVKEMLKFNKPWLPQFKSIRF